ncbi:hypothetical protein OF83DRAFT_1154182 [Amylostereum chailletii]|nr:hypothetical protein OF83DRAFT_1154182 [Amylostereum chailletii]
MGRPGKVQVPVSEAGSSHGRGTRRLTEGGQPTARMPSDRDDRCRWATLGILAVWPCRRCGTHPRMRILLTPLSHYHTPFFTLILLPELWASSLNTKISTHFLRPFSLKSKETRLIWLSGTSSREQGGTIRPAVPPVFFSHIACANVRIVHDHPGRDASYRTSLCRTCSGFIENHLQNNAGGRGNVSLSSRLPLGEVAQDPSRAPWRDQGKRWGGMGHGVNEIHVG